MFGNLLKAVVGVVVETPTAVIADALGKIVENVYKAVN